MNLPIRHVTAVAHVINRALASVTPLQLETISHVTFALNNTYLLFFNHINPQLNVRNVLTITNLESEMSNKKVTTSATSTSKKASADTIAKAKHARPPAEKKLTTRQRAIAANTAIIVDKIKLFQKEPYRLLTPDNDNRASVANMVKGCAFAYGPQLKQTGDTVFMFDIARLMYHRKADMLDGLDLDAFFAQGETYNGETHLHVYVDYPTFLMLVGRGVRGEIRDGVEPTEVTQLQTTRVLARMLRHVDTLSCWQGVGMGVDFNTGQPAEFLFSWPPEASAINERRYPFEMKERAYDEDDLQAFGTGWKKSRPEDFAGPNVDDDMIFNDNTGRHEPTQVEDYSGVAEQDASNEISRLHNKNVRTLKNLLP